MSDDYYLDRKGYRQQTGRHALATLDQVERAIELIGLPNYNNKYKRHRALKWEVRDETSEKIQLLTDHGIPFHYVTHYVSALHPDYAAAGYPTNYQGPHYHPTEYSPCSPISLFVDAPLNWSRKRD